ncbi:uncharacterized mitochondrial protein AtMg00810-like [Ziziphus jujuba]|uniref:Uncharacterized mitochondrial protein AtMg00810-like n=1 Tax=Ziziphus jujuba TaxID=326968 RepID=A0A6P3YTU3_ZIZJJ|nr:uncharacterized mitochondrial protein AtMg00810-like [Ziziphus jujuba]
MDSSLFLLNCSLGVLWVLVYVDDIIITGNNTKLLNWFVTQLDNVFSLKDLGPLHFFLGIEVHRPHMGLHLSQTAYINELLRRTNMLDCKSNPSPTSTSAHLGASIGSPLSDVFLYRSTIGMLQYLTITRPEISFIVNKLSQFMQAPTDAHWSACKRVLRFLQGSKMFGLLLRPSPHLRITGFTDAD